MLIPEIEVDPPHTLEMWFHHLRRSRQEAREKADPVEGSRRSRAVVTMVRDEAFFLPIWLRYYSQFFEADDIYVLDNESTDGSTEGDGFRRELVERDRVDHTWMVRTIERKQRELFEAGYDLVLVTDVDELVVPDPSMGDLGDYMNTMVEEFVTCLGYEMIHLPDREPRLDPERPILEQRGYWSENPVYNKSALATVPSVWHPGFHQREDARFHGDPELRMVHLHRVDYEVCLERHRQRKARRWHDEDAAAGWAAHNLITEGEAFDEWFFIETGMPGGDPLRIEKVPDHWQGTF